MQTFDAPTNVSLGLSRPRHIPRRALLGSLYANAGFYQNVFLHIISSIYLKFSLKEKLGFYWYKFWYRNHKSVNLKHETAWLYLSCITAGVTLSPWDLQNAHKSVSTELYSYHAIIFSLHLRIATATTIYRRGWWCNRVKAQRSERSFSDLFQNSHKSVSTLFN